MGLSIMAIPLAKQGHIAVYLMCIAVVGAGDGLVYLLIGPIVRHLMDLEDVSQSLGFMMCLIALPMTLGPILAGKLYMHGSLWLMNMIKVDIIQQI